MLLILIQAGSSQLLACSVEHTVQYGVHNIEMLGMGLGMRLDLCVGALNHRTTNRNYGVNGQPHNDGLNWTIIIEF